MNSTRFLAPPDFRPLYARVEDLLLERLAAGEWGPGDLLPSEPKLAESLGVSQGTVRKALDRLADRHVVVRRQGKGTFVASYSPDRALYHFFHLVRDTGERALPSSRVASRRAGRSTKAEQQRLSLPSRARVVRIVRVRSLAGQACLAERIVVPEALFPALATTPAGNLPNALYAIYESDYGVSVARAEERLKAVAATAEDAALLDIAPGHPLLEVDRAAYTREGLVVEWRVTRCETSACHYRNELE